MALHQWALAIRSFLSLLLLLSCIANNSFVSASHRNHNRLHHLHHREVSAGVSSTIQVHAPSGTGTALDGAQYLVEKALSAVREANKYRLEHPRFNRREFPSAANPNDGSKPVSILTARAWKRDNSSVVHDYLIPDQLAKAAEMVAESLPHDTISSQVLSESDALKAKYWAKANETNTPIPSPLPKVEEDASVDKRAESTYWMESIFMNGKAPYADNGYKVFRNVRDYGAKGDGKADDTVAINRAITDGGRCGQLCGSSMKKPAVVYFPSGTYLVSSSIIQYYNTQFLGNPINRPTILAAKSFVGLGVMSSNVYIEGGNGAEWYIPQNNFQRSIRNFIIDITNTDPNAYICGIHWQVAQATDLQNIDFYMKPGTTQQGIFMENGSGGSMSDLLFRGGNFGAYLGNQQFTSRNLIFNDCKTAIQVHWDWAWTMHRVTISAGATGQVGISIVGGAGGPGSTGQGVGSFVLLDSIFASVPVGISTSLLNENSTSMLIQNTRFLSTGVAVQDSDKKQTLIGGGLSTFVESWGFGNMVAGESGKSSFQNGANIPTANRTKGLTNPSDSHFFSRSAPTYKDVPLAKFINVKSMGARGDGKTDDVAIINQVLDYAANTSSIVFFPYGDYLVSNTVKIPAGSRIVGQAWSQIKAAGPKFANQISPNPVVQVGRPGDKGIVEISDMLFTTSAGAEGAIVVEWNIREEKKGSAAMWNSPVRVGGAAGTSLQAKECPKKTGSVNRNCVAAGMLFHLTSSSSAYLDNVWMWTADHDLDVTDQAQIDVYSGRGILIESQGPSWLWGTAAEHNVLYQYQLSNAKEIFMSMIQTETPYFQPVPKAPEPFKPGVFPNDPTFKSCTGSPRCSMSWALRVIDSSDIFIYNAGLYSWFYDYSQDCVAKENCQDAAVQIEQSSRVWLYSLATKAMIQMVSPLGTAATIASENQNGFLSSILAWLQGSKDIAGPRFVGWSIFPRDSLRHSNLSKTCQDAIYQTLKCDDSAQWLMASPFLGSVDNSTRLRLLCDRGCESSLNYTHDSVAAACKQTPNLVPGIPLIGAVDMIADRWHEVCLQDPSTGNYCNEVIAKFSVSKNLEEMPRSELCSYCNVQRLSLMQKSPFSAYDNQTVKAQYEYVAKVCGKTDAKFDPAPGGFDPQMPNRPTRICASGNTYQTRDGDSCDSIANSQNVSSASLYWINPHLGNCNSIPPGQDLCLPMPCKTLWTVKTDDRCLNISVANAISQENLYTWNPALDTNCTNLHDKRWGSVLCVRPDSKLATGTHNGTLDPWTRGDGVYGAAVIPPSGSSLASGTTLQCNGWYTHNAGRSCTEICMQNKVVFSVLTAANPSLRNTTCDDDLVSGKTYCVHPSANWTDISIPSPLPSTIIR